MKSILKWALACLAIYLIFLVVKLPAVHVLAYVNLPKEIKLYGVSGTIWQGQAQQLSYSGLPIENINWSLSALPLLWGEASADVKGGNLRQSSQIALNGKIRASQKALQASNFNLYIPANLATAKLSLPIPVKAQGRFHIKLSELDYDYVNGCNQVEGEGKWINAKVAGINKMIDLGNFNTQLGCDKQQVLVKMTQPNSLGIEAQATVTANMQFAVKGRFKPSDNLPKEVHQAAQFMGQKDNNGYYPIAF